MSILFKSKQYSATGFAPDGATLASWQFCRSKTGDFEPAPATLAATLTQGTPCRSALYKFKSQATGDLIMLEPQARRLLGIIGKEPSARGIIEPAQMSAAIAALEHAVAQKKRCCKPTKPRLHTVEHPARRSMTVLHSRRRPSTGSGLRQRAAPLCDHAAPLLPRTRRWCGV